MQAGSHFNGAWLVFVLDADKDRARLRQINAGCYLRLYKRLTKTLTNAHHFTGGLHFRTQDGVNAGEFRERKHRLFDREKVRHHLSTQALIVEGQACHGACSDFGEW